MTELADWLALYRIPGIGARTFQALLDRYGDPAVVLTGGDALWREAGLSERSRSALQQRDLSAVEQDLLWAEAPDHHILPRSHSSYPSQLLEIHSPPPLLFVHGDPQVLAYPQLAMVGSRNPSRQGLELARSFAAELARQGLVINSGLALGIDAAAHEGALQGNGVTVAVMGTGIDHLYPRRNRALAEQIVEQGAIVSELPTGVGVDARQFPRRNRIISGLSLGTLVVEAALKSGSLITAREALEQGREVFAIPGSIHNPLARGCHAIIRQGAKLVETAEHVLEELGPLVSTPEAVSEPAEAATNPNLDEDHQRLLSLMGYDPVSMDQLVAEGVFSVEQLASMLLILELQGELESLDGGRYIRIATAKPR